MVKNQFREKARGMVDGGSFYAGKTCVDDRGRRLLFGWIREGRTQQEQVRAGWSGVLSLPREVILLADGSPAFLPVPELAALRGPETRVGDLTLTAGETPAFYPCPGIQGNCLEVDAEFDVGSAAEVGISVLGSADGREQALVKWDRDAGLLGNTPLLLAPGEPLRLRLFVDCSVIEAFANDRACFTDRAYPAAADALQVAAYVRGGEARLRSLHAWPLRLDA
jgi:beta-fructofuranosidase